MENTFIVNIIHRPEMVPEYAEKVTGHGQAEDIGRKALLTESLDIFKFQQETAHKNGLKTTIQMTYASLFNEEAVSLAKEHHEKYGDEIALSLLGLPCTEFREKYKTKDFCIWMFSMEDKKNIVDDVFGKFHDIFGFYPVSTGSYYMDAELTNYIKEKYPSVKCAVATCWEEGPKAYHTCNNSWYTLFDGGPWNPWIPSKQNTHAPAANEAEDSGIVAIPHLSRDLLACYDGNGSNFGTHPQNVLRGMIYDSKTWEYPYLYNLIDQYRHLAKFNNGYSYNMMFVGPGWLNKMGRWEAPYEQCALWKDILYGSDKQIFWYCDPYMRAQINMDQGGAIVDLRPYAAKLNWPVGIGTPHVQDASYPFLIQEKYRAGYFTHYAGEGTVRSAKISYNGEEVDLCLCRTKATFSQEGSTRILTLDPVDIEFYDLTVKLQTKIYFEEGSSKIRHERTILEMSNPDAEVEINEYMVACYGTTEYPEDMTGITLTAKNASESKSLTYEYKCREEDLAGADEVSAVIPAIETKAAMGASGSDATGYFKEGYAFSPMFTLGFTKTLKDKEVFSTWLSLEKAN